MQKRFLATILTFCMMLTLLPGAALAEESANGSCGDNLTWSIDGDILTINGFGVMDSYNSNNVPWGSSRDKIKHIKLPDGLTCIGTYAFYACHGLTSISIPKSVTSIGGSAFYGCDNLTSISIPKSVTSIGTTAFNECSSLRDVYYGGNEDDWTNIYVYMGNQALLNATIHYDSTKPDDVGKKTISGVLRSGDGWSIRWSCDYQTNNDGTPQNGSVEITVNSTNTNEELYLYNEASNRGFPWELAPYNIPKSIIRKIVIRGQPDKFLFEVCLWLQVFIQTIFTEHPDPVPEWSVTEQMNKKHCLPPLRFAGRSDGL